MDAEAIEYRFYKNVRKTRTCWKWIGSKYKNGYGRLGIDGQRIAAHRFSYMYFMGTVDEGMFIHHRCANKDCVNPEHLEMVTPKENTIRYFNGECIKKQATRLRQSTR